MPLLRLPSRAVSAGRIRRRILGGLLGVVVPVALIALPATATAQTLPVLERPVPFDDAGRITTLTPALVARLALPSPAWPVVGSFRDARLYAVDSGGHVLVVTRPDGTVLRYALDAAALAAMRSAIGAGLLAQAGGRDRVPELMNGVDVSQPAGNVFVRNQTILGLAAYGPAAAALGSRSGPAAAAGGYLVAAGSSFFIAANLVKNRSVTRAQAAHSFHMGTRGAAAGAALAAIGNADGGPGYGAPILAGAVSGTVLGYLQARGLSDGEAASAGLTADLAALTVLGVAGASDLLKRERRTRLWDPENPQFGSFEESGNFTTGAKLALASTVGVATAGYLVGPRYARRAAYNVTAGDASVVLTSGAVGAVAALAIPSSNAKATTRYAVATGGLLAGAFFADRALVRHRDRTSADGGLIRLGTLAGGLMGAGVAALGEAEAQPTLGLAAAGGLLGLLGTEALLRPAPDAGPVRGIMQEAAARLDGRVFVSLGPVSSVRITF
jgi:hypothetical protein